MVIMHQILDIINKHKKRSGCTKISRFTGNQHTKSRSKLSDTNHSDTDTSHKIGGNNVQSGIRNGYVRLDFNLLAQYIAILISYIKFRSPTLTLREIKDANQDLACKLQILYSTCAAKTGVGVGMNTHYL